MSITNAIGMIIFKNPLYLVGACLSAWTHRNFISKLDLDIKLIAMVDSQIYKYKNELEKYFDHVELIELREMKLNSEYKIIYKYSEWMKYSISKWEILKFESYNKILFIDIDILPINDDFYEIFNLETPAIMIRGMNLEPNSLIKPEIFFEESKIMPKNNEYWNISLKLTKSLDAGFILLKPSKKIYTEYFDFIKICENNSGYVSKYDSGIDETTMLLFLLFYKKIPIHSIPYNYAPIPWDKFSYDKKKMKGINFISMIKPWIKLPMIQWTDENIWHQIAKKSLNKHSVITKIYLKYLIDELYKFYYTWKKNISKSNSPYNMESIKNNKIKSQTLELFKYLNSNPKEKLTLEQIEYIIDESVKIHKQMDNKLFVPINELEKII